MIKLLFSRRNHPGSWLIRAVSWSQWSHVEIMLPDGRLLGAAAPHGVGLCTYEERMSIAAHAATMCLPGDMNAAAAWGETQLGKPYDWLGVAGIGLTGTGRKTTDGSVLSWSVKPSLRAVSCHTEQTSSTE